MERYDVFISFKNTGANGRPTRDSLMAQNLYRALKQKGIRAFCSLYSIGEAPGSDYVDAIYNALESASIFVAVGTSRANLTSEWVRREINAYLALLGSRSDTRRSIISYRSADYSANDLPASLLCYQSYDDQKALIRFIRISLKHASDFRIDAEHSTCICEHDPAAGSASPATHSALQIGDVLEDRYEILREIGRGGLSNVYLASDRRVTRFYAIKQLRSDIDIHTSKALDVLRAEVRIMQQLNHDTIPKVFDVIERQDSFIIVMEYINGCALHTLLDKHGPFPEDQVLSFARQVALALDHMHDRPAPIIHRDIKPANLMLKPDGQLKLIDFGTARIHKPGVFADTICLGTIGFAAPEQFGGAGQTDPRTDIYNLGVTLHQLVTGKSPTEPPYEILPIRQIKPELSRGLELLIEKCIRKEPDARYQSAKELLKAIDRISTPGKMALLASLFKGSASRSEKPRPVPVYPTPTFQTPASLPPPVIVPQRPVPATPVPGRAAADGPPLQATRIHVHDTTMLTAATAQNAATPPGSPGPEGSETVGSAKAPARKVTVRTRPPAGPDKDADELLAKFRALGPDSRKLVLELIDRLSQ